MLIQQKMEKEPWLKKAWGKLPAKKDPGSGLLEGA
jgi:hypothetical protein